MYSKPGWPQIQRQSGKIRQKRIDYRHDEVSELPDSNEKGSNRESEFFILCHNTEKVCGASSRLI